MIYSFRMLSGRLSCKPEIRLLSAVAAFLFFHPLCALAPSPTTSQGAKADEILILKKDHVMELLKNGKVIRSYKIALGQGGLSPKQKEGDARTPAGHYIIDAKYEHSKHHKALHVSYPDAEDRKRAARLDVPPGGAIMIHGLPNGKGWVGARHRLFDWTLGCVAVTDEEIEEVFVLVPVGTPSTSVPDLSTTPQSRKASNFRSIS